MLLIATTLTLSSCFRIKSSEGGGQVEDVEPRSPDPADVYVPEGYQVEVVATGLTFPTGIAFDEAGRPHVLEAGYSYGEEWTEARLLRIKPDGSTTTVISGGKNGPWNGVTYHDGFFYIAEGGQLLGGKILKVAPDGTKTVLVKDLPSLGDHHTNSPVVKDGHVYFGQGTATNSAVVGVDNAHYGWLYRYPDFHDIPCEDVVLRGVNYTSKNPLTEDEDDEVVTGAYSPFGEPTEEGQVIEGRTPCSGAVMRVPLTGGEPEVVAWGFRNPYRLTATGDGTLYLVENSYDVRGNRPVWGTGDVLWKVQPGKWYGWPDYAAGHPLFGKHHAFSPPGRDSVAKLLKKDPNKPPKPLAVLGVHSSSNGLEVIENGEFGKTGNLLVAQFGDMAPTVGKTWKPVGYKVVQVDPKTGVVTDFVSNNAEESGPASWLENDGLERPIAVRFDPEEEALYIVDFGIMMMSRESESMPVKGSGVVWKVTRKP